MVYQSWMDTDAWRSLPGNAVKLLLYLIRLSKGDNGSSSQNGELFLSEREAARAIGVSRNTASTAFAALVDRGFAVPVRAGHFAVKAGERDLRASVWRLTFQPYPQARMGPTNDFLRWQPKENSRAQKLNDTGSKIGPVAKSARQTGSIIGPANLGRREKPAKLSRSIIGPHIDMPRAVAREPSRDEVVACAWTFGAIMAIRATAPAARLAA